MTIKAEGEHEVRYYSADRAGNLEKVRSLVFTIDKKAPEAQMRFDTVTSQLIAEPLDGNELVTVTPIEKSGQNRAVQLSDRAGNKVMLWLGWRYAPKKTD